MQGENITYFPFKEGQKIGQKAWTRSCSQLEKKS